MMRLFDILDISHRHHIRQFALYRGLVYQPLVEIHQRHVIWTTYPGLSRLSSDEQVFYLQLLHNVFVSTYWLTREKNLCHNYNLFARRTTSDERGSLFVVATVKKCVRNKSDKRSKK